MTPNQALVQKGDVSKQGLLKWQVLGTSQVEFNLFISNYSHVNTSVHNLILHDFNPINFGFKTNPCTLLKM